MHTTTTVSVGKLKQQTLGYPSLVNTDYQLNMILRYLPQLPTFPVSGSYSYECIFVWLLSMTTRAHHPSSRVFSQSGLSRQQDPVALFEFSFTSEGGGMGMAADTGDSSNNSNSSSNSSSSSDRAESAADNCVSGASTIGNPTRRPAAGGVGDRVGVDKKTQTLCVEYSHSELYAFFDQLERIQHQLDALVWGRHVVVWYSAVCTIYLSIQSIHSTLLFIIKLY